MPNTSNRPISIASLEAQEVFPGFKGQFVHSENMTMAYWSIAKNTSLPEHSHHHEQVVNMLEGEFELTLDGVPHHLKPGDVLVIPRNVSHSGSAISDCRILDVFQPTRDDYR